VYPFRRVLYRFDETDEKLELLPMAARRALDHAGRLLSREAWTSLPIAVRRRVIEVGAARTVNVSEILRAVESATPAAVEMDPLADPGEGSVPDHVRAVFAGEFAVSDAVWGSLSPLDRYALAKVAGRGRPERIRAVYDEIVGQTALSTHVGAEGGARMVDVGQKPQTLRRAVARSTVTMSVRAFEKLHAADVVKGDVLGTARLAGIMGAKRTADLIPLCHPVSLSKVTVDLELDRAAQAVHVVATAEAVDRTGVEMEALVAASIAALTIYDMLKSIDRTMVIGPTLLVEKSGGRSGNFSR
jgi:cyclic pyranopterin phosphate synthase